MAYEAGESVLKKQNRAANILSKLELKLLGGSTGV